MCVLHAHQVLCSGRRTGFKKETGTAGYGKLVAVYTFSEYLVASKHTVKGRVTFLCGLDSCTLTHPTASIRAFLYFSFTMVVMYVLWSNITWKEGGWRPLCSIISFPVVHLCDSYPEIVHLFSPWNKRGLHDQRSVPLKRDIDKNNRTLPTCTCG